MVLSQSLSLERLFQRRTGSSGDGQGNRGNRGGSDAGHEGAPGVSDGAEDLSHDRPMPV